MVGFGGVQKLPLCLGCWRGFSLLVIWKSGCRWHCPEMLGAAMGTKGPGTLWFCCWKPGSNRRGFCAPQARRVPPARSQRPAPPLRRDRQNLLRAEHLPDHVPPGPGALPPCPGLPARPDATQVTWAHPEPPPSCSAQTFLCLAEAAARPELCNPHGSHTDRMLLHACPGLFSSPILSALGARCGRAGCTPLTQLGSHLLLGLKPFLWLPRVT